MYFQKKAVPMREPRPNETNLNRKKFQRTKKQKELRESDRNNTLTCSLKHLRIMNIKKFN